MASGYKNDISYISFISQFEKYMITRDTYSKFEVVEKENTEKKHQTEKKEKKYYDPNQIFIKQFDKFFWCFYIFLHDKDSYFAVNNKHFQIEKDMKIDLVNKIRSNKGLLKEAKLKVSEIENNVVNDKKLDISGFQAFCIYYNLNVMICCNNIFYCFHNDDDEGFSLINIKEDKFTCEKNINETKINEIKQTYYYVENPKKPLKAIGNYKVDELIELCKLFKLTYYDENHKNLKKTKLYELVINKMN